MCQICTVLGTVTKMCKMKNQFSYPQTGDLGMPKVHSLPHSAKGGPIATWTSPKLSSRVSLMESNNPEESTDSSDYVTTQTPRGAVRHPPRPLVPSDRPLYSRKIPHLGGNASFHLRRTVLNAHLGYVHVWLNDSRVNKFWQDAGTLEEHREYLSRKINDAHNLSTIGSFADDGGDPVPAAYFDIYWAKEDPIGEYYDADDYDRGLHMLVGDEAYRGPHRVKAWLPSLCDYIFKTNNRTNRIVSEPDHRNERMIGYLLLYGFKRVKDLDFPYKRAALMILDREEFERRWKEAAT